MRAVSAVPASGRKKKLRRGAYNGCASPAVAEGFHRATLCAIIIHYAVSRARGRRPGDIGRVFRTRDGSHAEHRALNCKSSVTARAEKRRERQRGWFRGPAKEQQPKTGRNFAYTRAPDDSRPLCMRGSHPLPRPPLVALPLAYRYGYDIRHTRQTTNGYSIQTTSRPFLRETLLTLRFSRR